MFASICVGPSTAYVADNRYHDGYTSCTDSDFKECSGVLLGTYIYVSIYSSVLRGTC